MLWSGHQPAIATDPSVVAHVAAEERGPRDLAEERAAREGGLWPLFLSAPGVDGDVL